ncbi:DUF7224 domain-containing protein [Glycomyces salinus]|uniref:DUF7224 domain-containing protein n=1 Tax=Glycomyces salinus TaxID=980294 RepID=UPI001E646963|nr:hypothetical protein [Glycomyces salinus]
MLTAAMRMADDPFDSFNLAPLVVSLAVLSAWTLVGAAAGAYLPPVAAAPAAAIGGYVLYSGSAALTDPKWRHLTGYSWSECCTVDQQPDPTLIWASLPLALAFALAAILVLSDLGRFWTRGLGAVAAVATAGAIAFPAASGLGYIPVVARDDDDLTCETSRVEVCVWPESRELLPLAVQTADQIASELEPYEVDLSNGFRQGNRAVPGQWRFVIREDFNADLMRKSMISALQPSSTHCDDPQDRFYAMQILSTAWIQVVLAEVTPDEAADDFRLGPDQKSALEDLLSQPAADQGAWFDSAAAELAECPGTGSAEERQR